MNKQQLFSILGRLSGHLVTSSPQQETEIQRLHEALSKSLLPEDIQQIKSSRFTFENADLFSPEQISSERAEALQSIAEKQAAASAEPEFRVFVRDVLARSSLLPGSVPAWANGAAVDQTLGPFTHKDGRQFWFDLFRIEKLVALYIQGVVDPVLLFNVRTGLKFIDVSLPPVVNPLPVYHLPAGSIWVNSQYLASNAPAGAFTGFTIKGGTVLLSAAPTLIGGKLTLSPNTVVTVELTLQQPAVQGADPTSPYGIDARQATLQLPQNFTFHFSGQAQSVDLVSTAEWQVYGQSLSFTWNPQQQPSYNALLQHIFIQLTSSSPALQVNECQSPYFHLQGKAPVIASAWELPVASIDILHPIPAAGIGSLVAACSDGLSAAWAGLKVGNLNFHLPFVALEPGHITLADFSSGTSPNQQTFNLWKDEQNPFGSDIVVNYPVGAPFFYQSFANGIEILLALVNADVQIDRPVTAAGQALAIHSKSSFLLVAVTKAVNLIELYDDNILFDNTNLYQKPPEIPQPISLALHNALFKTTPVNGCFLVGQLANDLIKIKRGFLFLTFGLYAYLPTLPDPYAANIGSLRAQFRRGGATFNAPGAPAAGTTTLAGTTGNGGFIWMWLVCEVSWRPGTQGNDNVKVAFYFAPLQNQFQILQASAQSAVGTAASTAAQYQPSICETLLTPIKGNQKTGQALVNDAAQPAAIESSNSGPLDSIQQPPDYQAAWDEATSCLQQDFFALLDVSTNADLLGVSFNVFGSERMSMVTTFGVSQTNSPFPLQVEGMDVVSSGNNVRAFTLPEISWEPALNTAPHVLPGDPPGYNPAGFPAIVPNYYPDDGGPTHIFNNSVNLVPLSPIPVSQFIVGEYAKEKFNITSSLFTLPFGMRALAVLDKFVHPAQPPTIDFNRPEFDNDLTGGLQLKLNAGYLPTDDYPMFNGGTLQINNILDLNGNPTGSSTLGQSVSFIFNDEFKPKTSPNILVSRGVPLTRIDLSGYGASIFSNWLNPLAQMAQTSQSQFDVFIGRAAHEVIQVKSIIYPWGIRVVRTIILYRASTGYVYRVDTGWKAQSDGLFDFSYYVKTPAILGLFPTYQIHPGVVQGLFNIKNIVESNNQFPTQTTIAPGQYYLDPNNNVLQNPGPGNLNEAALLQMVFFDADIAIENVVQGQVNGKVPSKKIMGFVQLAPRGIPLSQDALKALLASQPEPIGGPIDAIVDIGQNGQKMRLNHFDVSNSLGSNGTDTVFAAAVRGHVILPQDGAWSMVQHLRGTGEVTPLPDSIAVPLIRIGQLAYQVDASTQKVNIALNAAPDTQLLRLADPTELLRPPVADTLNYGFLHSTDTQKALFLTPAYQWMTGAPANAIPKLLSKTPPLFADAFRIVNSKAIFPNVGDATSNLGDAISLYSQGTEFVQNALTDGGVNVLELMQINQTVAGAVQEGYKLLKQIESFSLPNTSWTLIEIGGAFKIYIEYKADNIAKADGSTKSVTGSLDFDVDSFANNVEDRWKSLMNDVALVVDLGPISRLMTIKGNWDAQMGSEAQYSGSDTDPDFPSPQIEFAPELQPIIEILQILQDIQTENYKDAFQQGLKLAMSNKADSWEYKLEASKEIPVVRFPTPDFLYNDPNAPLKLEAGLKLGAYFNAALKVTTDPTQLLPTAGGYLGFYGRLSVMCVSLSVATIYAIGQANLDIGADSKTGPSLDMKFGFGAQIVVGLPVVGNVSVLYMVGVEIFIATSTLSISAFMLFQGHAELLGGIVGVTITIEAKGTVSRTNDRTDLAAQVTFGLDISIFLVIDISFSTSWSEQRQIA